MLVCKKLLYTHAKSAPVRTQERTFKGRDTDQRKEFLPSASVAGSLEGSQPGEHTPKHTHARRVTQQTEWHNKQTSAAGICPSSALTLRYCYSRNGMPWAGAKTQCRPEICGRSRACSTTQLQRPFKWGPACGLVPTTKRACWHVAAPPLALVLRRRKWHKGK